MQSIDQLQTQMMLFLATFEYIWSIGLIIFGEHLMNEDYYFHRLSRGLVLVEMLHYVI
ncbi:hypothetical protein ABET51_06355 [Metabacillus fastidiosus]|uniref:hypothetical protein n=1 Tax=Metabacillus fastidiosus TaxID=1458 RepID=UPI003D2D7D3C